MSLDTAAPLHDPADRGVGRGGPAGRPGRPQLAVVIDPILRPEDLLAPDARRRITELAHWDPHFTVHSADSLPDALLARTDVLLTSWGAPCVDEAFLARAPRLKALIHAAGSLRGIATEAAYDRGVVFSSAAWANALPVAEYTLAAILAANKDLLGLREHFRAARTGRGLRQSHRHIGNYRRVVGVVGASRLGRRVIELLRPFDLDVLVHDPYLDAAEADRLGVPGSVELDELCRRSDVLTLHAPAVPATHHMIDRHRLALLRDGATLVNTARGALVDLAALTAEVLSGRLRLVDDVTEPPADSPLYDAPGAFLTPHIAGSYGTELTRLGHAAVAELTRYCSGEPFVHGVSRDAFHRTA